MKRLDAVMFLIQSVYVWFIKLEYMKVNILVSNVKLTRKQIAGSSN